MKRKIGALLAFVVMAGFFLPGFGKAAAANEVAKGEIVFADAGWDSNRFHNAVAGTIAEKVYGYSWTEMAGSTPILHEGLLKGEIDVHMEVWTDNIATYRNDLAEKKLVELGTNFDDDYQGFYVPRYVIEGDKERGIEPMAPDLKTVKDLLSYKELFKDAENPSKGRVYGAIPGWAIDTIMHNKFVAYGFDQDFIYFRPGSDAALSAALSSAFEKGEPVVGYYWEPTWLMGKYDFVLLEDEPFNPDTYEEGLTALPAVNVTVAASNDFSMDPANSELIDFLSRYRTSSKLTSEALAYMQDTGADYKTAALWFIEENKELVRKWVGDEGLAKLEGEDNEEEKENFEGFPFRLPLDVDKFDSSVRQFASSTEGFFGAIRSFLNSVISGIEFVLDAIPWFIILALVFFLGWRSSGSIGKGILYVVLLSFIGAVGLWEMMNETLSIVITSVIVSLTLGFPIGILVSTSEKVERLVKPVLDTMQTMPVFVYLIPALLFFGLGKAPAVIATTIYAIVPIIRMTTLGINQIDGEILEAAKAYGATYMQALIKVKIPQAMPAIMTGVNQTIMMAVSMVVTTSMIGASGLGMEVLTSVNRIEMGRGLVSGAAVVILAVILDRFSQGLARRKGGEKHE